MKKIVTLVLAVTMIFTFIFVGCEKKSNISQKVRDITQQILDVTQSYLNGDIDAETAEDKAQRFMYRYPSEKTEEDLLLYDDVKALLEELKEAKRYEALGSFGAAEVIKDVYIDREIIKKCDTIEEKMKE